MLNKSAVKKAALSSCQIKPYSTSTQLHKHAIGIRREDKNRWERRVPLTPTNVKELIEDYKMDVLVQPSTTRAFADKEYEEVGAIIEEDLSKVPTIIALKEVPKELLIPEKTYSFFSHTIKAQTHNMGMLDEILRNKIRLLDYEKIVDPITNQRLVKFGHFAGLAGAIDTLHVVGERLLTHQGFSTPFVNIGFARNYANLEIAKEAVALAGEQIARYGLPKSLYPFVITLTGSGAVSSGVKEMLNLLPCKFVDSAELKEMWSKDKPATDEQNRTIYVCIATVKDMVEPINRTGSGIDVKHYYQHPEQYKPIFHERVLPYTRVLFNGIYWEPKYPKLVTTDQARDLLRQDRLPLIAIGDITCDINGSVDFLMKATTIDEPSFNYDVLNGKIAPAEASGKGIVAVLGVDNWPASFSRSSSEFFGKRLVQFIPELARAGYNPNVFNTRSKDPFGLDQLPPELSAAVIASHGKLTPAFEYINAVRKERKLQKEKLEKYRKKVLLLGSGMVVPPIVEYLLRHSVVKHLTIGGIDVSRASELVRYYTPQPESVTTLEDGYTKGIRRTGGRDTVIESMYVDVSDQSEEGTKMLDELIEDHDIILSLVPAPMHPTVARFCIKHKRDMVTASYISPEMKALSEEAEKAGIMILNEIGLDPGIDHMCVMQTIEEVRAKGGKITGFQSYCGALPSPECADNPVAYKFSWSPRGVLTAAQNPAIFKLNNQIVQVPGNMLLFTSQSPSKLSRFAHSAFAFEMIPNRDSLKYIDYYGLSDTDLKTMIRGTLRYPGFTNVFKSLKQLGLLEQNVQIDTTKVSSWFDVLSTKIIENAGEMTEKQLEEAVLNKLAEEFTKVQQTAVNNKEGLHGYIAEKPAHVIRQEASDAVYGMRVLGLFSKDSKIPTLKTTTPAIIDLLCAHLEQQLSYKDNERDFIYMHHEFQVSYPNQKDETITATLCVYGENDKPHGFSATAKTVGLPVAISAIAALRGDLKDLKGVCGPTAPVLYNTVLKELENEGITVSVHTF